MTYFCIKHFLEYFLVVMWVMHMGTSICEGSPEPVRRTVWKGINLLHACCEISTFSKKLKPPLNRIGSSNKPPIKCVNIVNYNCPLNSKCLCQRKYNTYHIYWFQVVVVICSKKNLIRFMNKTCTTNYCKSHSAWRSLKMMVLTSDNYGWLFSALYHSGKL